MTELMRECLAYYERIEGTGAFILVFKCPYCEGPLKTKANISGSEWDALSTCWHCHKPFIKFTPPNAQPIRTVAFEGISK